MLQLLLLTLTLTVKIATADEFYGSGIEGDDEPGDVNEADIVARSKPNLGSTKGNNDGTTTIIIIASVCLVVLAIVAVIAVVLFRRYLEKQEQGVYTVPVEQGQKGV